MGQRLCTGGMRILVLLCFLCMGVTPFAVVAQSVNGQMTEEKALALAEQFGIDVGEVDEEIQEFLGLTKAEGVVVFEVIGGTPADLSGIKVKAVIKEVFLKFVPCWIWGMRWKRPYKRRILRLQRMNR